MKNTRNISQISHLTLVFGVIALSGLWTPSAGGDPAPNPDHRLRLSGCRPYAGYGRYRGYRGYHDYRGEAARQLRRIYESQYRSRNVYRSSRHADPWQNPYRSSRHYQRELALSRDGYVVHTIVHGDLKDVLLDPGLHPYPVIIDPCSYAGCPFPPHLAHDHYDPIPLTEREAAPSGSPPAPAPPRKKLTIHNPTQQPVMKQITLADGRVKTVITSALLENDDLADSNIVSPRNPNQSG